MIVPGSTVDQEAIRRDRLIALNNIISNETIDQVPGQMPERRRYRCKLSDECMIRVVIGMGLFTDLPIRGVYRHCRQADPDRKTPARSSLCKARQRLGSEPLKRLYHKVVRPLATAKTPGGFYRGWRKVAIDGTVLDVPDCEALQHFGRASGSHGEGPFPQVRKVSLIECGTHVELDFVYGGWSDSEKKLVPKLWESIPEDALLIQDRGFYSYSHWKALHQKCQLLVRVQKSMVVRLLERLADGSFLAKVYSSNWYRDNDKNGIVVRVIEYKLDDPQRVGHDEVHRLITTLTDSDAYPAEELICEYHERWESELVFDEQKTHQVPTRAEKTTNLRSETVAGTEQELYAISLAHFIIRSMMFDAAEEVGMDVDRLSFKGSFQIIKLRLSDCPDTEPASLSRWYALLKQELREETIPPRRNRINPRVIKRKMSRWLKKRPKHRKPKPLTKTFAESTVIKK